MVLEAIALAGSTNDRATLLDLAVAVPLGPRSFPAAAAFLAGSYPARVRRAAMRAVARLGAFAAFDALAPFLALAEPELRTVLSCLSVSASPPDAGPQNGNALDPLARLAREMRTRHRAEGRQSLNNEGYALLRQLVNFAHPQLVPILLEWALANDHVTAAQAFSCLQQMCLLHYERTQAADWWRWWSRSERLLRPGYALGTAGGRQAWLSAWDDADDAGRHLLLRLWADERQIDERALVEEAVERDGARRVLAELWQRKRLSAETREAIVRRFLTFRLVERPNPRDSRAFPHDRHVQIVASMDFPFPPAAWISYGAGISFDERPPELRGDWISQSTGLQGAAGRIFSEPSGTFPGATQVSAVVQLEGDDPLGAGCNSWRMRWQLGPLILEKRPISTAAPGR